MLSWMEAPGGFAWVGLLFLLVHEAGLRLGRRRQGGVAPHLMAALVVWLGLLQASCLFQALQKQQQQTDAIHQESDAIAHVYRLLETLPKANRTQMRLLLIAYLEAKLNSKSTSVGKVQEEILGLQSQLFLLGTNLTAQKVLNETRGSQLELLLNQMISLHYRSEYTLAEGLPGWVLSWILGLSLMTTFSLGLSSPREGRNWGQSLLAVALISSSLVVLLDANRPMSGAILVDTTNYRDLVDILHHQEQL
jgi:hypothetical protein